MNIPLKIWHTWKTKDLPYYMSENLSKLKEDNPEFEFFLLDDNDAKIFLSDNFNNDVLYAFNNLIPGAYKADLLRCCLLYIHGGIYLDIKLKCINFKLITLTDKEHFCLDRPFHWGGDDNFGIYNAIMITYPKNSLMLDCINNIIYNVKTCYYGLNPLHVTGPGLLGKLYLNHYSDKNNIDLINLESCKEISFYNNIIIVHYDEYRKEQENIKNYISYDTLWKQRNIYIKINPINESLDNSGIIVPKNLFQIWHTHNLPKNMNDNIILLREDNPEFNYKLFDFNDALYFLKEYYDEIVLNTFLKLIPRAYKSDFLRYCILYIFGGIYLDVRFKCIYPFTLNELTFKEHYVLDLENLKAKIFKNEYDNLTNGIIVVKPRNKLMLEMIKSIINNVKNKFYGCDWLNPTGPILMAKNYKKIYNDNRPFFITSTSIYNKLISSDKISTEMIDIYFNKYKLFEFILASTKKPILKSYDSYNEDLKLDIKHIKYSIQWANRNIYTNDKIKIPLKIWQTWKNKKLPEKMEQTVNCLKFSNPEFEYNFLDDNDALEFISKYYPNDVKETFLNLIPGAYKADLLRYCLLYKYGGIYLDIKLKPISNFSLKYLIEDEHFCLDRNIEGAWLNSFGIYNAILICAPKNRLMYNAIINIVYNYKNNLYKYNSLHVTGPGLLSSIFSMSYPNNDKIDLLNIDSKYISYYGIKIFEHYDGYREDQKNDINYKTYDDLWHRRHIYRNNHILNNMIISIKNHNNILRINDNIHDDNHYDLIIDEYNTTALHTNYIDKFYLFNKLFFKQLNKNGTYIILYIINEELLNIFLVLNEQVTKRKYIDNSKFTTDESDMISSINFKIMEEYNIIIITK